MISASHTIFTERFVEIIDADLEATKFLHGQFLKFSALRVQFSASRQAIEDLEDILARSLL